jgi:5-aminopentanamidase
MSAPATRLRAAVGQMAPELAQQERNREHCLALLEQAAAAGARLLVLPECAISGYMFASEAEGLENAEELPGPTSEAFERACARLQTHVVYGMLERHGDRLRNTAVLIGPDGLVGSYRKTHLPFLGVDRFTEPGDELPVFDTPLARIGLEICYDLRFGEVTRTLALKGAELVALPTNYPVAARIQTEVNTVARAAESRVFLLCANRVGSERDARFGGWSQIVDPHGKRLAEAGASEETLLVADLDLAQAREKGDAIPGGVEFDLLRDRRPELYGALVEQTQVIETLRSR